jgi:hypothetical protein
VRARAEVWTSGFAESAADAVVVALDMSTPHGRRRKKVVSVASTMKEPPLHMPG